MKTQNEFSKLKEQWRARIIKCYYLVVCFLCLFEIMFFAILFLMNGSFNKPLLQYILLYTVSPTVLNFVSVYIADRINQKAQSEKVKNYALLGALLSVCTVVATVHSYFLIIMGVFVAPMIVTTLLDDLRLQKMSAILSVVCLYISIAIACFFDETWSIQTRMLNSVVCVCLIISIYLLTMCVAQYAKSKSEIIIRTGQEKEEMMQALKIDTMTGLFNHSEFYQALDRQVVRVREDIGNASCAVVVIDVDLFKSVNDTYGHENGDLVLQKIAKILKEECIEVGNAYRYGGEEFALLLPDYSESQAYAFVETIRKKIYDVEFTFMLDQHISISAGIYQYKGEDIHNQEIFSRADDAMYYAKRNGRNRCINYGDIIII